jgi:eukaryotic-like serine/threonine-protein kinase
MATRLREVGTADPALELLRSGFAGLAEDVAARIRRVPARRRRLAVLALVAAAVMAVASAVLLGGMPPSEDVSAGSLDAMPSRAPSPSPTPVAASTAALERTEPRVDTSAPSSSRAADPLTALAELLAARPAGGVAASDYVNVQVFGDLAVVTARDGGATTPPPILMERTGGGWSLRSVETGMSGGTRG